MPALGVKLRIPTARRALVSRVRLTDTLPQTTHGEAAPRLVVVAAPAGCGKTTLLAQWLRATTEPSNTDGVAPCVAWLSLDLDDSDLRRFLTQLIAAVQVSTAGLGVEASQLLQDDPPSAEDVIASLINDLDAYAGRSVIVLDDYHVIVNPAVHQAVAYLLDNLPPQVTLAIATRSDPPLPVARLRARGEVVEIRAADLRFTHAEAAQFFNDTMGIHLDPDHVTALSERIEGWAAGLQLAALSARGRGSSEEVAEFVESFSGSHRFVLDYLLDEVVGRQPDEVTTFLLATSVLTQLTGGLCDAVTGRQDSQHMLERLEADGLFVIPLDEHRRWFRYHHLFADALRARLPTDLPGRREDLHAAAAEWLAANGLLTDAIQHALASQDQEYAAELIELSLGDQRRRRQDPTLREWANRLDGNIVRRRPLLATFVGWSRLAQGDVDGVEPWLDTADAALADQKRLTPARPVPPALAAAVADRDSELRALPSMIEVYRAAVAQARGNIDGTTAHAHCALDLAGPADHFSRGAAHGFLGLAAWAAGDLTDAVDTFTSAIENLNAAGMRTDALGSVVVLAQMWLALGDTHRARALLEQAVGDSTSRPGPVLATSGDLYVMLADVLREQGDLDGADLHLRTARSLGDRASLPENRYRWFTAAALLQRVRGDLDGAVALLDTAEGLYLPGYFPDATPIHAIRARLHLAHGRLEKAQAWSTRHGIHAEDPITYLHEYNLLTYARLLTATDHPHSAIDLAGRVHDQAAAAGRTGSVIEARLVRAIAHDAADSHQPALDDLAAALTIGAPAGYRRRYLDEGPAAHRLLGRLAATPSEAGTWAQHVLATQPSEAASVASNRSNACRSTTGPADGTLPESLSDRELDVLRLLATDLTGPDIARQLFISVNTFRTHTKHIFTKLDVQTRRSAVRRAGELGLL